MAQSHEDDLFRGSSMTFGEHLEELRKRLFRAAAWLAVGLIFGLAVGQMVVNWIQTPLTNALKEFYRQEQLDKIKGTVPSDERDLLDHGFLSERLYVEPARVIDAIAASNPDQPKAAGINSLRLTRADLLNAKGLASAITAAATDTKPSPARHVYELLSPAERDVAAAIAKAESPQPADVARLAAALDRLLGRTDFYDEASFAAKNAAIDALKDPSTLNPDELRWRNWQALQVVEPRAVADPHTDLAAITVWHKAGDDPRVKLIATSTMDPFVIYVKMSLLAGFILASPMIFRELWLFVAAGLYPHERRYVYTFLPFSVGLFLAGAFMAFFIAFPPVLKFLLSFNSFLGISPEPRISEWLTFVLFLPLAFGIGFQLPLVMLFVNRIGLVSVRTYLVQWRMAILVILITATLLCPSPDLYSMLLMAVPMIVLYFGGIALCHWSQKRRPKALGGE